jgi:hypothetical protein
MDESTQHNGISLHQEALFRDENITKNGAKSSRITPSLRHEIKTRGRQVTNYIRLIIGMRIRLAESSGVPIATL